MKHFTAEEANALLGEVTPLLEALRDAQVVMSERHEEVISAAATNGGGKAGAEFMEASRTAGRSIGALQEMGIVVRDPATGLIDFPGARDGEEIFLCWRLGEGAVEWWHPTTSGFSDRRPL